MADPDNQSPDSKLSDLREKQSVRATFKLSKKAVDSIGLVAVHMGIKQKSLFDYVIEDLSTLKKTAEKVSSKSFKDTPRVQKTYVLSRKTITLIETIAGEYNLPRDLLVEHAVRRLESLIKSEKGKHGKRKTLFAEASDQFYRLRVLFEQSREVLGEQDPFCLHLAKIISACEKGEREMKNFIEKGNALEEF